MATIRTEYKTEDGLYWDNEDDGQRHANYLATGILEFRNGDTYQGKMKGKHLHDMQGNIHGLPVMYTKGSISIAYAAAMDK